MTAYATGAGLEPMDERLDPDALDDDSGPQLDVVTASDVCIRRVAYVWEHRIPIGAMTLMPGEEGIGKTTVGVRIIADLTRGILAGEHRGTPRDVLVVATEDGLEDVFVPRLREAGADLDRVHIVRARIALDGSAREVIVPRDLQVLSGPVRRFDAALVWIDSLVTTLPDELKSISYKDVAKVLRAITHWAEVERVAVAAPWHLNKATGSDTAVRIMDSRAFRTAVRSMLLVVADPDAPEGVAQGIVALDKANAGTLNVPGLRYRIRSAAYVVEELDEGTGEVRDVHASCGVVDWLDQVKGDARQIARAALTPQIEKADGPDAWLRNYLTEEGESLRTDALSAASDEGFSASAMTRAARKVGVLSRDQTGQDAKTGRPWRRALWSLPAKSVQSGHTDTADPTDLTGESEMDPTEPVVAGQPQSRQSRQSGMGRPDWGESDSTGEIGQNASSDFCACGRTIAWQRVAFGKSTCVDCEQAAS